MKKKFKSSEKLRAYWSKKEGLMLYHPEGFCTKCDAGYLSDFVFPKAVLKELEDRGYDITTIKFSIAPKEGDLKFFASRPEGMTDEEAWEQMRQGKRLADETQ